MQQYLLAVHRTDDESVPSPDDIAQMYRDVESFNGDLRAEGAWVFAGGLHPPSSAAVVDARGPEVLKTDGPLVETEGQLGGFWIIKTVDRDTALAWAAKASRACRWPVEVRPFQEEPEG